MVPVLIFPIVASVVQTLVSFAVASFGKVAARKPSFSSNCSFLVNFVGLEKRCVFHHLSAILYEVALPEGLARRDSVQFLSEVEPASLARKGL